MVLFRKQISSDISIAIWQIIENEEFFWDFLHLFAEDETKIKNIKLPQVRLQKLACRAALAELLGSNEIGITYSETGQPLLKDHHISFSHTKNTVAVALANTSIGIDIEELTPRISHLYPRFMNQEEIADCDLNNLQDLYYYWCAKEAMYKWVAERKLDFVEDLRVYKNEGKGVVCKKHVLKLTDFLIGNQLVAVTYLDR
jgi:phosphopantetheinyl transferase